MDELRAWWEALFQIHEYATYPELAEELTTREVDFLEQALPLQQDMSILDLACGAGRHLLALAQRGYHVDGVELATPVATHLAELITQQQLNSRVIERDMRDLEGLGPYDVVLIMNSSFGFFSDSDHMALLQSIAEVLTPQGKLLLQCINPYQISTYMKDYRRGWHAVGPGFVLRDAQFVPQTGTIEANYHYIEPGEGATEHPGERIRIYTYPELLTMLRIAGLTPIAAFGDTRLPVVPFDEHSLWQVIVARK